MRVWRRVDGGAPNRRQTWTRQYEARNIPEFNGFHRAVTPDMDAMQVPRLTVQATVHLLDRDDRAFDEAAAQFIARFPHASTTLSLGDFRLFELVLGRGRYVEGFARAFNVSAETFRSLPG